MKSGTVLCAFLATGGFASPVSSPATPQAPTFVEVNVGLSGVTVSKLNWGDYDNDGDLDLAFEGWESGARFTRIYRNNGGTFAQETNAVLLGLNEGPVILGDYDNDGDLDLAFGGWSGGGTGNRMYRNDGGGSFTWLNNGLRGMKGSDGVWGDYDNDGDLDLVLAGESYDTGMGDYSQIYRNDGGGVFTLAVSLLGLYEGKAAMADYDGDGDLDLILSGRTVGSRIYRNDGGAFTDLAAGLPPLMYSGVAWGDYDNDGDPDLALFGGDGSTANHFEIYRNDAGTFTALGAGLPSTHFGELDWGDYDNDGDLDILMTGLDSTGTFRARVYRNNGGAFADAGLGLVAMDNAATSAWGDYDNDGDLDIIIAGHDLVGQSVRVYRNDSAVANTAPSVPGGLSATPGGNSITFQWTASSDAQTPAAGLSYNLRVGTTPGGQEIMAAMSDLSTGWRRLPSRGNAQQNLSWTLRNLSAGTYYYSVQAVDGGFMASGWAAEAAIAFVIPPTPLQVTALTPASGSTLAVPPATVTITLAVPPDPATVNSASVRLARAGADLTLGTADDVPVTPNSLAVSGNQILINLAGLNLPNDQYRLILRGDEAPIPNAVNWWKLDEGTGTTAADSVGAVNGTLGSSGTSPTWTTGRIGAGLSFAGADNRVTLGAADLAVPWTAAMWVHRADSPAADSRLMDSSSYSLRLEQFNGTPNMGVTAYSVVDSAFGFSAPVGQWVHVAFVGESDGTSLNVNGALSQKIPTVIGCPRGFLGSIGFNSMTGVLDEVRLFSRKLTQGEIAALAGLGGVVRGVPGNRLDGEFGGTYPSGNGAEGGDFIADFTLATPAPRVTSMTPAPGSTVPSVPAAISIVTNGSLDPATVSPATVRVIRAGPDGILGTGDDVAIIPASVTVTGGSTISIALPGGLPSDQYRVTVSSTTAVLPGPVNQWTLDEGSGAIALDSAGPNNGTLGGAGGSMPAWTVGRVGNALRFGGDQDRVTTAAGDLGVPWTAAMWVRRTDSPSVDARIMDSISFPSGFSLRLEQFSNTNQVGITQYGAADYTLGYTAPPGAWTHLAFVGSPGGVALYANGLPVGSIGSVLGLSRYNLGSHGANSMIGMLDDVRVYGVALTPVEVALLAALEGAVRNTSFVRLDGEFSGPFPSGNGLAGGDFVATFTAASASPPSPPPTITDLTVGGCGILGAEALILLFALRRWSSRRSPGCG